MYVVLTVLTVLATTLALVGCGQRAPSAGQRGGSLVMLDGKSVSVEDVEASIARAMDRGGRPGSLVRDHQ